MKDDSQLLTLLLDIQYDIVEAEKCYLFCKRNGFPAYMNCIKDEAWFAMAEELGFLSDNGFIPIIKMIELAEEMPGVDGMLALEAMASELSLIAIKLRGDWAK